MPITVVSPQLFHSLLRLASTAVVDSLGDSPGKLASLVPRAFKRNAGDFLSSAAQAPASLSSDSLSTALSQAVQQKPWTARDDWPPVFSAAPSDRAIGEKTGNARQPSPFRSCSHSLTAFPQLSRASLHSHCGQLVGHRKVAASA
ncbi:hypothetical protein [Pseudomonas sp. NBRC 100443]|uniref:hypothetical protein n=1 Tax=Pseudomonas sp. NBRC 100443 TaxID=1113665 RepID=UPI002552DE21|nr:hypothetical protein [Pseudomonas sp. NBRC 100443]